MLPEIPVKEKVILTVVFVLMFIVYPILETL
jgi:hypothetical protein